MTKIEPALYRFRSSEQVIAAMHGYTPPSADWEPLYTEAQMRQLGEACAVAAWNTGMSLHMKQHDAREVGARCAGEIRNLIKEMLG